MVRVNLLELQLAKNKVNLFSELSINGLEDYIYARIKLALTSEVMVSLMVLSIDLFQRTMVPP